MKRTLPLRSQWLTSDVHRLVEAAACVANAVQAGAGGLIQGTLMEKDLRDALGLKRGEYVEIPRATVQSTAVTE